MAELPYFAVATDGTIPEIGAGPLAARPAPGQAKRLYLVTDPPTPYWSRDDGAAWTTVAASEEASSILAKLLTLDTDTSGLNATTLQSRPPADFQLRSEKNQASGYLGLNSQTLIDPVYLPSLAIDSVNQNITSDAQMTALTAEPGDVAIRTDYDPDRMYMLAASPASTLANWVRVTFGDVASVNGQTGVVTLGATGVSAIGRVRDEGTLIDYASELDFIGAGVLVSRNATTGRIEVTISGASAGIATEAAAGIGEIATDTEIQTVIDASTFRDFLVSAYRLRQELDRRLSMGSWTAPSLTSGWTNFAGEQPIQYRKNAQGIVTIRGTGMPGTFGTGATLFTLPVGFRPAAQERFGSPTSPNGTIALILVQTDGRVVPMNGATSLPLSGISFEAGG